jgi:uncharacterized protein (TIGR03437 family)
MWGRGVAAVIWTLLLGTPFACAQNVITTVAGASDFVFPRSVRTLDAPLDKVTCVAVDAGGNVYLCDATRHIVAKVSRDGTLTVVAGNGISIGGYSGDGGPATSASLNYPAGVAVDDSGNIYIADTKNHRIRKVSPQGIMTTVAGKGSRGFSGDGGPGTSAALNQPLSVAVDVAGNILIADSLNDRVRKVGTDGVITTVAGSGVRGSGGDGGPATGAALYAPEGVAVDRAGNLYIADTGNQRLRKVSAQGTISTLARLFSFPRAVAVHADGNLYIADDYTIRKVSPQGAINTVAGSSESPPSFSGDGGPATSASLDNPDGVAVDAAGNLYIADTGNQRLRKVSSGGTISTLAGSGLTTFYGDGGPANAAGFNAPTDVAVDSGGNLYIADSKNQRIRKINAQGTISTVAGNGRVGDSGDGGPAISASLNNPVAVAVDAIGNIYIADQSNNRIRKVNPQGIINTVDFGQYSSYSERPQDVAVDTTGNLYAALPQAIIKVSPQGTVIDIDTGLCPVAVAVDAGGNIYWFDRCVGRGENVWKRTVDGRGVAVAGGGPSLGDGGPATSASLNSPHGLALDAAGNLYIADTGNQRIRKVNPQGIISTVAGNGRAEFFGDGGPATTASLNQPNRAAVDAAGNLYIADTGNNRIRKVLAQPATFSTSPTSLSFTAMSGSATVGTQQLTLTSNTVGLGWETTAVLTSRGGAWLSISPQAGPMPAVVTVSVDATNLAAGAHQGTIEISVPAAMPSLVTIAVTLTVSSAQPANLSIQPSSLSFQVVAGGTAPPAQSLRIENAGGGALTWKALAATFSGNWLAISPESGSAPAGMQVSVSPSRLAAGSYSGTILVLSDNNQTATIPVNLLVSRPAGVLLLSQGSLLFRAVQGGGAEPPQDFGVLNVGSGILDWTARAAESWLRVSPDSGRSDSGATQIPLVNVSVDPTGLAAGFYVGLIRVTAVAANNSPQVLRVDLQVLPRGAKLGAVVRPTGLIFVAAAGGSSPGSQQVGVATTESEPVEFLSQPIGGQWVRRVPESGITARDNAGRIVVQPDLGSLTAGVYRAGLTVLMKNDGSLHPVNLLLLVLPPGTAMATALSPQEVRPVDAGSTCTASKLLLQFASVFSSFNAAVGWPTVAQVNARDDCGNPATGGTVVLSFSSGDPALTLTDLKNGQYLGAWRPNSVSPQVVVTARGSWRGLEGQAMATAQVGTTPNPQANILSQGGVVLGAGFERGPLAPGSIVALFGRNLAAADRSAASLPLPRSMDGVRVLIGGIEAPLFYVGPGQVNAQVPFELSPDRQLQVLVETRGVPSAPEPLQTAENRPGLFTLGGALGNQGAILIANTNRLAMRVTPNIPSEPAQTGSIVSIFCTGLGATEPAVASGEPAPASPLAMVKTPVTATIDGQPATVSFAGLAPGFVGVYQVNVQVPAGITPGDAVAVVLSQGGFRSNVATIAVR